MKQPEEVYLVTQYDSKPDFYHPAKSVKLMSRKAMQMKIASWPSDRMSFTILRAHITDWEDVTEELIGG